MFDFIVFGFLVIGAVLGYMRGAYASVILLLASYIPLALFVYFYDFISGFVTDIFKNTSDGLTAALGGLGAFSGIIALIGLLGAVFFATRLILKIMKTERLDRAEKIGGAVIGVVMQNIAATLAFFLIYTAIPVKTTALVRSSLWILAMRPLHLATYPHYRALLEARTQSLSVSIADKGIAETFTAGISLGTFGEGLGFDQPNVSAAASAVSDLAKNVNLDEISELIDIAKTQDVSPEAIDKQIKQEQAARLREIQRQLN